MPYYDVTRQFPITLLELVSRTETKLRFAKTTLGATSGSAGGSGTPPGGFDGQLAQRYVAYDTTESYTASGSVGGSGSTASLVDNLNRIRYWIHNIQNGWLPNPIYGGGGYTGLAQWGMNSAGTIYGAYINATGRDYVDATYGDDFGVVDLVGDIRNAGPYSGHIKFWQYDGAVYNLRGYIGKTGGLVIGAASGSSVGTGTVNVATGYYINGVPVISSGSQIFSDAEGYPANVTNAAAYGTSNYASRRDHVHTILLGANMSWSSGSLTSTGGGSGSAVFNDSEGYPANIASAAAYGTSVYASRRDHVHTVLLGANMSWVSGSLTSSSGSGSGTVGGTGAQYQVAVWNSTSSLSGYSNFNYDANGNLGLGGAAQSSTRLYASTTAANIVAKLDIPNTDYVNTSGSGSHIYMTNSSATGQNVISSSIQGTMIAKWRTDYSGNVNWVAYNGYHGFYTGGDFPYGSMKLQITNAGNSKIGDFDSTAPVRATIEGTCHLDIFDGVGPSGAFAALGTGISIYSSSGKFRVMDLDGNSVGFDGGGNSCTLTLPNAATSITGGGTLALGGYTLTILAAGTATLGTGTQYQLPVWTGTNTIAGLGTLGTSGAVLQSAGAGANPAWSNFYLAGPSGQTYTFPAASGSVATLTAANVFTTNNTIQGGLNITSGSLATAGMIHVKSSGSTVSSVLRLETNNDVGTAGTGNADVQFYDNGTLSFRFLAALGNNPAVNRYGGFLAYTDRDGTKLPLWFFTTDTGGTLQLALKILANQTAGTPGALVASGEVRVAGDTGGQASSNTITGVSNTAANSTGVGTIKFKGTTNRDSSGFIKIYIGTTQFFIPVFSAITG